MGNNYLDYIPAHNELLKSETDSEGQVTIFKENKGFFNFIAQKCFKKPRVSQIHLDKMGSFIWSVMDGKKSIYDIGQLVSERFKDEAEPLYNRLVQYIRTMESYGFIRIDKSNSEVM